MYPHTQTASQVLFGLHSGQYTFYNVEYTILCLFLIKALQDLVDVFFWFAGFLINILQDAD